MNYLNKELDQKIINIKNIKVTTKFKKKKNNKSKAHKMKNISKIIINLVQKMFTH